MGVRFRFALTEAAGFFAGALIFAGGLALALLGCGSAVLGCGSGDGDGTGNLASGIGPLFVNSRILDFFSLSRTLNYISTAGQRGRGYFS